MVDFIEVEAGGSDMLIPDGRERESRRERERRRSEWRPQPLYIDAPAPDGPRQDTGRTRDRNQRRRVIIIDEGADARDE